MLGLKLILGYRIAGNETNGLEVRLKTGSKSWISVCQNKEDELKTESHQRATLESWHCHIYALKGLFSQKWKKAIRKDKRAEPCYSKCGLPPAYWHHQEAC